jgi:excisionase family DNA binding protein
MEELTTAEIAARVGKTERTVQRWLKSGKLPALPLTGKRYGVNPKDLEHLKLPEHLTESGEIALDVMQIQYPLEERYEHLQFTIDDLTERLHDAEEKIERLQYRLDQILKEVRENASGKKKAPTRRKSTTKKRNRLKLGDIYLDSILPLDLVSLTVFAEQHGVPWSAVTKAIKDYQLFPERGTWKDGWRTVKVAIDERGCKTFYELFHGRPGFTRCNACPHTWR